MRWQLSLFLHFYSFLLHWWICSGSLGDIILFLESQDLESVHLDVWRILNLFFLGILIFGKLRIIILIHDFWNGSYGSYTQSFCGLLLGRMMS
jgi:hypothetical protein